MDSFYGGKQGISFVIKARFKSIEEMQNSFNDTNYNQVWYGEYCIIDTPNKDNVDNGKVFRRTNNTIGDTTSGLWEYIGQIVGPAGGVPVVEIGSLDYTNTQYKSAQLNENTSLYHRYYDNESEEWKTSTNNTDINELYEFKAKINDNETTEDIIESITFKSGRKYEEEKESPQFKYNWFNFRNAESTENGRSIGKILIGFEIPYVDFDFIQNIKDTAYYNTPTVIEQDPPINDFYRQYELTIPVGLPGGYFCNLRIEKYQELEEYPYTSIKNLKYVKPSDTSAHGKYTVDVSVSNERIPIDKEDYINTTIWVCDFKYPTGNAPTATDDGWATIPNLYVADSKEISNIEFDDNGTLSFEWTDNSDATIFKNKIEWVTDVNVDDYGVLTTTFNVPRSSDENETEKKTRVATRDIKWIKDINLSEDGYLTTTFNTLERDEKTNEPKKDNEDKFIYEKDTLENRLNWIDKVELVGNIDNADNSTIETNRQIKITYNNNEVEYIGDEINYIQDMVLVEKVFLNDSASSNRLLVLFNAPTYRDIGSTASVYTDDSGTNWFRRLSNTEYTGEYAFINQLKYLDVWYKDLGVVRVPHQGVYSNYYDTQLETNELEDAETYLTKLWGSKDIQLSEGNLWALRSYTLTSETIDDPNNNGVGYYVKDGENYRNYNKTTDYDGNAEPHTPTLYTIQTNYWLGKEKTDNDNQTTVTWVSLGSINSSNTIDNSFVSIYDNQQNRWISGQDLSSINAAVKINAASNNQIKTTDWTFSNTEVTWY